SPHAAERDCVPGLRGVFGSSTGRSRGVHNGGSSAGARRLYLCGSRVTPAEIGSAEACPSKGRAICYGYAPVATVAVSRDRRSFGALAARRDRRILGRRFFLRLWSVRAK